ncbi:hypothetical protein DIPPA_18607 [Diplonema papillatum]|nr:hypothetical protein DIPPA_18607 [Diplonema papillatum]
MSVSDPWLSGPAAFALASAAAVCAVRWCDDLPLLPDVFSRRRWPVTRVPEHLVAVLQDGNEAATEATARLVGWAKDHNIRHLTLYHTNPGAFSPGQQAAFQSSAGDAVQIVYWSAEDGRPSFLKTADALRRESSGSPITEEVLGARLSDGRPDPEMMLVFGDCRSIYAFPPWPIAVTEIMFHGSVARYSKAGFENDLHLYGKTKKLKGV